MRQYFESSQDYDWDPLELTDAIDVALESLDTVLLTAELPYAGRMTDLVLEGCYKRAMTALRDDTPVLSSVLSMESVGQQLSMEGFSEFATKIWEAIVKAFKWLMDKIGLGSEDAENKQSSTADKIDKAEKKIKDKFDKDGKLIFTRTAEHMAFLGRGQIRPDVLVKYVDEVLVGNQKSAIELSGAIERLIQDSSKFVSGGNAEAAKGNIDKSFELSKSMSDIIEKNVPLVKDLRDIAKHKSVTDMADSLKAKLVNVNVRGFGPYPKNAHVLWLKYKDEAGDKWSGHIFTDLSNDKEKFPVVDFGNSQDYAKYTVEILDALRRANIPTDVSKATNSLSETAKKWMSGLEKVSKGLKTDADNDESKVVMHHARKVLSYVNANVHLILGTSSLATAGNNVMLNLLMRGDDTAEANDKEAKNKEKVDAKAAKAAKNAAKDKPDIKTDTVAS